MPSNEICPGTCNSHYRKARAIYEAEVAHHAQAVERLAGTGLPIPNPPQPPAIDPVYGEPVWCPRCKAIIRTELADLDELAAHLMVLPPGIRPAVDVTHERVKVSGTHAAPSPSPAADDLDELVSWLRAREHDYRQGKDWPAPPRRGFLAGEITSLVVWVGAHLDGMLTTEHAAEFGSEIRVWHGKLVARAHAARSVRHVKKACPRCRLYTLWEEIGQDYIRCRNVDCNRMMTREELRAAEPTPAH